MKKFFALFLMITFCSVSLFLYGCGNGQPKTVQKTGNSLTETKTVEAKSTKSIPKDFVSVKVLNQVIHVPKEFKKMDIPNQNPDFGLALIGDVWKKVDNSKDPMTEHYNVSVSFEKSADLKNMKPHEEEQVLEIIFKNSWNAMLQTAKVATNKELISKKMCSNINGHKYIKVVSISGKPNKPNLDMLEKIAIYIFDDTIYFVSISELVRANNKYATEIDTILDTFGVAK